MLARKPKRIDPVPEHLALIPDGNRRWSRSHSFALYNGYEFGIKKLMDFGVWAKGFGVKTITVWALSTENVRKRSKLELSALYQLYIKSAHRTKILAQRSQHRGHHDDEKDLRGEADMQAAVIPEPVGEKEGQKSQEKNHTRKDDQDPEFPLLRFQPHEFRLNTRLRADLFDIRRLTHALHSESVRALKMMNKTGRPPCALIIRKQHKNASGRD